MKATIPMSIISFSNFTTTIGYYFKQGSHNQLTHLNKSILLGLNYSWPSGPESKTTFLNITVSQVMIETNETKSTANALVTF